MRTPILSETREVRGIDIRLLDSPGQTTKPPLDYHALIHGGLQGTVVMRDGKPLFVNKQAVDLFGLTDANDILQMPSVASFFFQEDWFRLKRHCDALELHQDNVPNSRLVLNAKNAFGQSLVLLVNAQPMDWHGQSAVALSIVDVGQQSVDITSALLPKALPQASVSVDGGTLSLIHI